MHFCDSSYALAFIAQSWPDSIRRLAGQIRFFDRSGTVRFPVDGSKLASSRLIITAYDARDHITRHLDTPAVRLADLSGLPAEPMASRWLPGLAHQPPCVRHCLPGQD